MAGTKPGPASTGRKVKKVSVALRPEDVKVLQRLSLEVFSRQMAKAGAAGEAHRILERGERPSVSAAIRFLIDAERARRAFFAHGVWKSLPHQMRPMLPLPENLLDFDFVFGASRPPATELEEVFAEAYRKEIKTELRAYEFLGQQAATGRPKPGSKPDAGAKPPSKPARKRK
jgi:hypothetical protein